MDCTPSIAPPNFNLFTVSNVSRVFKVESTIQYTNLFLDEHPQQSTSNQSLFIICYAWWNTLHVCKVYNILKKSYKKRFYQGINHVCKTQQFRKVCGSWQEWVVCTCVSVRAEQVLLSSWQCCSAAVGSPKTKIICWMVPWTHHETERRQRVTSLKGFITNHGL